MSEIPDCHDITWHRVARALLLPHKNYPPLTSTTHLVPPFIRPHPTPGPCTWTPFLNGTYMCVPGVMTTNLSTGWLPKVQPPDGIYGDPQLLVLESRDPDSETRNFGPVSFQVSPAF